MEQEFNQFQELIISLALIIILPTTIYFGCKLISPEINHIKYNDERIKFFKDVYKDKNYNKELEDKLTIEWKQNNTYLNEYKYNFNSLIITGIFSCILFLIGSIFVMPIIATGLLFTANILLSMNYSYYYYLKHVLKFNLVLFELFFVIISLFIVLYYAYLYSEKNK